MLRLSNANAGGLVTLSRGQFKAVANAGGILTVKGSLGVYKCSDCGHEDNYQEVDLWTRCNSCFSSLVTDEDVMSLEEVDPI